MIPIRNQIVDHIPESAFGCATARWWWGAQAEMKGRPGA
jgi:hypothetical protein